MAIQQRRGAKADFDATKMLPGELAVTTDGSRKVYVAFAPGDAKELASTEDVEETIQSGIEEIEQKKEEALAQFPNYEDKLAELEIYKANSIIQTSSGTVIHETDCAAVPPINIKLFGKSKQDGMPSIETPIEVVSHGESGSIGGKVLRKNFFNKDSETTVTIKSGLDRSGVLLDLPNETYTLKHGDTSELEFLYYYVLTDGDFSSQVVVKKGEDVQITIEKGQQLMVHVAGDYKLSQLGNSQLEIGEVATDYSPYTEQPFTFQTPNGLRGIPLGQTIPDAIKNSPIHMSGVYWDNVEQQYYIGDTKNEDGKDVQRVGVLDNNNWRQNNILPTTTGYRFVNTVADMLAIGGVPILCTHFIQQKVSSYTVEGNYISSDESNVRFLNIRTDSTSPFSTTEEIIAWMNENNVKTYYILAEPIVTKSDVQYDVVMNYPNTTIVNDAGAYMEVEYVADTKKHIEQNYVSKEAYNEHESRIAELEKAIVNS